MSYQHDFIEFIYGVGALKFGDFTLKSGRVSPYFFNAGLFNSGKHLSQLSQFYATAIMAQNIDFSLLFGPAYKGIPLASTVATVLYEQYQKNITYSFNRKETKDHGEGGNIVGAKLTGNVLIIDDVITAGTAISEVMDMMATQPVTIKGVMVALDRQERGKGDKSAISEVMDKYGFPVFSIINLDNIVNYLTQKSDSKTIAKIERYRTQYGV